METINEEPNAGVADETDSETVRGGCLPVLMACLMADAVVVWGMAGLVSWIAR